MYLRTGDSFDMLPDMAARVIQEIEALDGDWAAWVYDQEYVVAEYKGMDDAVFYFELDVKNVELKEVVRRVHKRMRYNSDCGHSYDCCGCWFFQRINGYRTNSKETVIFVENWGRNV